MQFSVFPLFYFAGFLPNFSGISLWRDQAGIMLVWSPDNVVYTGYPFPGGDFQSVQA